MASSLPANEDPDEPASDPFAEIGKDAASRAPRPMPKSEVIRKTIACFVFLLGAAVMGVGIVVAMEYEVRAIARVGIIVGAAIIGLAYAMYDGRVFSQRRKDP
jgi:uncharacterized YccA/Bax inhibitor family protein